MRAWLLGLLLCAAAAGRTVRAGDTAATPYFQAHQRIEIGPGRALNLYCIGAGNPIVVFDYGWGGPPTAWEYVQAAVGRQTTACSYDPAGYGFSDPGPLPRDSAALVDDLHRLLIAAHLKPPYVLVAHSLAGLTGTLFADRYLEQLAGMVLVDPAFAHQAERFGSIPGVKEKFQSMRPPYEACMAAAKSGRAPADARTLDACMDRDAGDDELARAIKDQWDLTPAHWATLQSEAQSINAFFDSDDIDSAELDRARRDWGNLPLIVLTSSDKHYAEFPRTWISTMSRRWRKGHDELAARSTRGRQIVVPGSNHYIQLDHPQAVIDAIDQVLGMARAAGR